MFIHIQFKCACPTSLADMPRKRQMLIAVIKQSSFKKYDAAQKEFLSS
jgi:hypothetical protein